MALEYKQGRLSRAPLDLSRCKAAVSVGDSRWPDIRQCKRNPWQDGWCKQHHPDTEAERAEAQHRRWKQKYRQGPAGRMADLEEGCKVLLVQRDELARQNNLLKQALGAVAPHALEMIVTEFENGGD